MKTAALSLVFFTACSGSIVSNGGGDPESPPIPPPAQPGATLHGGDNRVTAIAIAAKAESVRLSYLLQTPDGIAAMRATFNKRGIESAGERLGDALPSSEVATAASSSQVVTCWNGTEGVRCNAEQNGTSVAWSLDLPPGGTVRGRAYSGGTRGMPATWTLMVADGDNPRLFLYRFADDGTRLPETAGIPATDCAKRVRRKS
jgi:hypothetical protein